MGCFVILRKIKPTEFKEHNLHNPIILAPFAKHATMTLEQYLNNINQRFKLGNATEHTFSFRSYS